MESWLAFVRAVAEAVRVAACAARPKPHSTSLTPAAGGVCSSGLGVRSVEDRWDSRRARTVDVSLAASMGEGIWRGWPQDRN